MDRTRDSAPGWDDDFEGVAGGRAEVWAARRTQAMLEADYATAFVEHAVTERLPLPGPFAALAADVEADAHGFGDQLRFAGANRVPIPCLGVGEIPVPIEIQAPIEVAAEGGGDRLRRAYMELVEDAARMAGESDLPIVEVHAEEAQGFFLRRVRDFLAARFTVRRAGLADQPVFVPFRVVTQQPGWRIRQSPAYLSKRDATVFGAPSTPVVGKITPARWMFGIEAQGVRLRWDRGEFDVPPSVEAVLIVG